MAKNKAAPVEALVEDMEPEAPEGETKEQRFERLATYRFERCVKRMRQMHNLASANYKYTEEQADRLCDALQHEVSTLRNVLKRDVGDIPKLF